MEVAYWNNPRGLGSGWLVLYWFDSDVPLGCDMSPEFFAQTKKVLLDSSVLNNSLLNQTLESLFAELEVQWFPLGVEVAEEVVDIDDLRLQVTGLCIFLLY